MTMLPARFLILSLSGTTRRALETLLEGMGTIAPAAAGPAAARDPRLWGAPAAVFVGADEPALRPAALCRRLREHPSTAACAVVMVGARRAGGSVVSALEAGADDYWEIPFNGPVCRAYLRAMLRRLSRLPPPASMLALGGLRLDPASRTASLDGRRLTLRPKEFDLLRFFLEKRGQALGRDVLLQAVWGYEYFGTTRTVDFHVGRLRSKLGPWAGRIETVAGHGYRLSA